MNYLRHSGNFHSGANTFRKNAPRIALIMQKSLLFLICLQPKTQKNKSFKKMFCYLTTFLSLSDG